MIKHILLLPFFCATVISCNQERSAVVQKNLTLIEENLNLQNRIDMLKLQIDSLKGYIHSKYIFDTTEIRIIPSPKTFNQNKVFEGEFVLIGYNKMDSAYIRTSMKNKKAQKITHYNGGYPFSILKNQQDSVRVYMDLDNKNEGLSIDYMLKIPYSNVYNWDWNRKKEQ